jgi:hypothetical protein
MERFHEGVIRGFPGPGKIDLDFILIGPQIHRLTGKLAAIITETTASVLRAVA